MPTTDELASRVEGIVHEKTQRTDAGLDLTVAEIYEVAAPGRVDFGGGELESADLEPHERTWRDDTDDYQWWHLDAGQYLIEYNESLTGDQRVPLQIRDALRERGASHPTLHVAELLRVPLSVGGAGLKIKENARVSTLLAED